MTDKKPNLFNPFTGKWEYHYGFKCIDPYKKEKTPTTKKTKKEKTIKKLMGENKIPEEILYKHLGNIALSNQQAVKAGMLAAMKEYGDQQWNAALEYAAENAKIIEDWHRGRLAGTYVDKQSILSGERKI